MKILLVDDSKTTRYALRITLQHQGVEVDTADSAESAFETLKSRVPDAVLMDHIMPGLNGLEALEIIHADPRTAHLPVVLCTSQEDGDLTATAMRKGVLAVLPKSRADECLPEILGRIRAAVQDGAPPPAHPANPKVPGAADHSPVSPGVLSRPELLALIDERLEAALNRRLTALIEDLRRDLTEVLLVEARHVVDTRLADEPGARAATPPHAALEDLQGLESRLIRETLPGLVEHRVAAERVGPGSETWDSAKTPATGEAEPGDRVKTNRTRPGHPAAASLSPWAREAGISAMLDTLRQIPSASARSLRAALKRLER